MNLRHRARISPKLVKIVAAIVIGLSIGTMTAPSSVTVPVIGPVSGLVLGGVGLVSGGVAYRWIPPLVSTTECACGGSCGCS